MLVVVVVVLLVVVDDDVVVASDVGGVVDGGLVLGGTVGGGSVVTAIVDRPTVIVTVEPRSRRVAAAGSCEITTPSLALPGGTSWNCVSTLKPSARNRFVASPCVRPSTTGTATGAAPLDTWTVMLPPRSTSSPWLGEVEMTNPSSIDSLGTRSTVTTNSNGGASSVSTA